MMARVSSDLLIGCIEDIRAERRTLEACVVEHPQLAAELYALAPLALAVDASGDWQIDPGVKSRTRQQLLGAIAHNGHGQLDKAALAEMGIGRAARLPILLAWPAEVVGRLGAVAPASLAAHPWVAAVSGAIGALLTGGAVVYAAQSAPPDSVLYPVHQAVRAVSEAVGIPPPEPLASVQATATAVSSPPATPTAAASVTTPRQPTGSQFGSERSVARDDDRRGKAEREEHERQPGPEEDRRPAGQSGREGGRNLHEVAPVASSASADRVTQSTPGDGHGPDDGRRLDDARPTASASSGSAAEASSGPSSGSDGGHDRDRSASPSSVPSASQQPSGGSSSPAPSAALRSASSSPSPSQSSGSGDGGRSASPSPSPSSSSSGSRGSGSSGGSGSGRH